MRRMDMRRLPYYAGTIVAVMTCALFIDGWNNLPTDGAVWETVNDTVAVRSVGTGSTAALAGLRAGDRILSVGGEKAEILILVQSLERHFSVGDLVDYEVLRGGATLVLPVMLQSMWSTAPQSFALYYILLFAIIAVGVIVLVWGPDRPDTRVFFVFTQAFATALNASPTGWDAVDIVRTFLLFCGLLAHGPALVHFFLLFPRRHPLLDRYPRLLKVLYGVTLPMIPAGMATTLVWRSTFSATAETVAWATYGIGLAGIGVTLAAGFALAVRRFATEREFINRNRLRWVLIGMFFGVVPSCTFALLPQLAWSTQMNNRSVFQLVLGSGAFLFVVFGSQAIFRYRLWEMERYVKRGLLYAGLTALVAGSYVLFGILLDRMIPTHSETAHLVSLILATLVFLPLREVLQRWIDTLFRREAYDPTKVIERFEQSLTGIVREDLLIAAIVTHLNDIFQFRFFVFYARDENGLLRAVDLIDEERTTGGLHHIAPAELQARMAQVPAPATQELSTDEALLRSLRAELVVPLVFGSGVLGVFVCGAKMSGHRYSMVDLQLISLLAQRSASFLRTMKLYRRDQDGREEFSRQLISSQEGERRRVAGELHDGLGQYFLVIMNRAKMVMRNALPEALTADLSEMISTASQGIEDVRNIAYGLSPYHLEHVGLRPSIEAMVKRALQPSAIRWSVEADSVEQVLPKESHIHVYRIVQECVNNVLKHSGASQVDIALSMHQNAVVISVRDNGRGFDQQGRSESKLAHDGFGFRGIAGRARLLNGTLKIASEIGIGTTVTVTVPAERLAAPGAARGNR